jgi:hypothetical protein
MLALSKAVQALITSVAVDICWLAVIALVWYLLRATPAGSSSLLIPFSLGNLLYLAVIVFIGMIALDIGHNIAPFAASEIARKYKGKAVVNWEGFVKTVVSIVVLTVMWAALATSVQSLAGSLKSWIDPSALVLSYNLFFAVILAYFAIMGTVRSRSPSSTQSREIVDVSWRGLGEAVKMSQYLKRLEGLRSSGQIDEVTYENLHGEYETKLREAIELS